MTVFIQRESTEYVFTGITGTPPSGGAEVAFKAPGQRPDEPDWSAAELITNSEHTLWAKAQAAGVAGTYFIARLIGTFGGGGVDLAPGQWQEWVRLTDTVERPVRIAPEAVEVQ